MLKLHKCCLVLSFQFIHIDALDCIHVLRYDNMDLDELESRLDKINKEEISKIKKVEESYNHTKEVMKQLMNDNLVVDTNTISKSLAEEEEDMDKSMFINC